MKKTKIKEKQKKTILKKRNVLLWMLSFLLTTQMVAVSAFATDLNPQTIVNYVNGLVGTTNSSRAGYCLSWVFDQYKNVGAKDAKIGKSCNCAYEAGDVLIQSTSRNNIPLGTLIFFSGPSSQGTCSVCGHKYGHVGIYVGDDYVVSIHGNGSIKREKISSWESWGYPYRGWGVPKNVNLLNDTEPPTGGNIRVTDLSANGYTVTVDAYDNVDVTRVAFPTWTTSNGQDDITWGNGTRSGNTWTYRVNISDHRNERGVYNTHIYAYDAAGNYTCLGGTAHNLETEKPVIKDVKITNVSRLGYTVSCTVTDNDVISKVEFPTWTDAFGQDDLIWHQGVKNGNTYSYQVKVGEHKNELGDYYTHIYAWDACGNKTSVETGITRPIGCMQELGSGFYAIIQNKHTGTVLTDDDGSHNVTGRSFTGAKNQYWYFTKKSNGYYKIASVATPGYSLDSYGMEDKDGANVCAHPENDSQAQEWKIYANGGGYVLVPTFSQSRTLDLENGLKDEGTNVKIWTYTGDINAIFDIVKKEDPNKQKEEPKQEENGGESGNGGSGQNVNPDPGQNGGQNGGQNTDAQDEDDDDEDDDEDEDSFENVTPGQVTLSSAYKSGKNKMQVFWVYEDKASGYQVQAATNKRFSKNLKNKYVKGSFKCQAKIKKLKKKTYYVRVRAYTFDSYGETVYGPWSSVAKVKMK